MNTNILYFTSLFILATTTAFAQNITEKFEVKGSCSMCETRIEKAAKSVAGVSTADWDQKTALLVVTFDKSKSNVHKIQTAIAAVGHDTPMHKAKNDVYDKLPACCKYDRTGSEKSAPDNHSH
jgi:copper chaperone CopZ